MHFPFCRRKCTYCVLHSRCGIGASARADYVARLVAAVTRLALAQGSLKTVYLGGGSPALCDLRPLLEALSPLLADGVEFTVELHPLDVTDALLATLRAGGVNRISMGLQSLDDATLAHMGRGHSAADALRAFARIRQTFDNAGVDLIVGYPGDPAAGFRRLGDLGLAHCSVYSLQLEDGSALALQARKGCVSIPSDEETLDRLRDIAATLSSLGLTRYEISNYARAGCECGHNLATWRGEDYIGLGEGAAGRLGLRRTMNWWGAEAGFASGPAPEVETVDADTDWVERRVFRLRTREGLDLSRPEIAKCPVPGLLDRWRTALNRFVSEGVVSRNGSRYWLTARGTEVCDTVLAELV